MRRLLITLLILIAAGLLVWAIANTSTGPATPPEPAAPPSVATPGVQTAPTPDVPATIQPATPAGEAPGVAPAPAAPVEPIPGLRVVPVEQVQPEPQLGSASPEADNPFAFEAKFTPWGGGIIHVLLAEHSAEVGERIPYPVQHRLLYSETRTADGQMVPTYRYPMAASAVTINGTTVPINYARWQVVADQTNATQATFTLTIADEQNSPVVRLTRTWSIEPGRYDLKLDQRIENLAGRPLSVAYTQTGPADLPNDGGYMGDQRKLVMGYGVPMLSDPRQKNIETGDFDFVHRKLTERESDVLWPGDEADPALDLAWVATTNRYFAAAVSAPTRTVDERLMVVPLETSFPTVRREMWGAGENVKVLTVLTSPPVTLAAGASQSLPLELFVGPKDPDVLRADREYVALKLGNLIVYNLGGMCAFCTFAWLADLLMAFLNAIDFLVRDWGVAIIVLVAVVRLILHPLTVRSQVNMMKMSKQMASLQPEIERLKQKFGDNQQKMNQEMMKLYRERGVNPAAMGLGCVPMVLQMPIWFALYAMLYYAIELRHEPAFYGVFQAVSGGSWKFLADLSSPDHFISLGTASFTIPWLKWHVDSVNILPILMAGVFWLQQKYTAQAPAMNDQARQQQAMMKWMVLLFPVFLYKAPSGLTLYILTSTAVGIVESRRVRKHVKEMEESGRLFEKKQHKPGGLMDRLSKMAQAKMQQAQAMQEQPKRGTNGKGPKRDKRK
jgi:YidC/Oxa1 family membrane protein insertase